VAWAGERRSPYRQYRQAFRRTHDAKDPALRVGLRRAPAVSPRSTVFPDTLFASVRCRYRPWRIASPQSNAVASIWPLLALPRFLTSLPAPFGGRSQSGDQTAGAGVYLHQDLGQLRR